MRILESNPDHSGVLNYLGYMWADRGIRLHEALAYIRKATEMDPYNEPIWTAWDGSTSSWIASMRPRSI